jgi:hypothetical protein
MLRHTSKIGQPNIRGRGVVVAGGCGVGTGEEEGKEGLQDGA